MLPAACLSEETQSSLQELYVTKNNLTDKCVPLLTGHPHLKILHMAFNHLQTFPARFVLFLFIFLMAQIFSVSNIVGMSVNPLEFAGYHHESPLECHLIFSQVFILVLFLDRYLPWKLGLNTLHSLVFLPLKPVMEHWCQGIFHSHWPL